MTDEEFRKLAADTARNAGGLRPLARHVREVYSAVRALQGDDNSFSYVAEVLQKARGDQTDATAFMQRVKTYYHRDRVAHGDLLIDRSMSGRAGFSSVPPQTDKVQASENASSADTGSRGLEKGAMNTAETASPATVQKSLAGQQLFGSIEPGAPPQFQYKRPGQRRIV